jgi:hypothetical protein
MAVRVAMAAEPQVVAVARGLAQREMEIPLQRGLVEPDAMAEMGRMEEERKALGQMELNPGVAGRVVIKHPQTKTAALGAQDKSGLPIQQPRQ